jgi:hypothetical protein
VEKSAKWSGVEWSGGVQSVSQSVSQSVKHPGREREEEVKEGGVRPTYSDTFTNPYGLTHLRTEVEKGTYFELPTTEIDVPSEKENEKANLKLLQNQRKEPSVNDAKRTASSRNKRFILSRWDRRQETIQNMTLERLV